MAEVINPIPPILRLAYLQSQAEQTRKHDWQPLPRCNPYQFASDQRIVLFNLAASNWTGAYLPEELRFALDPNHIIDSAVRVETIKTHREYAQLLRSAYHLFDQSHAAPFGLEVFIRTLGEFKDQFQNKPKSPPKPTSALRALDLRLPPPCLIPCDDRSYRTFLDGIASDIRTLSALKTHSPVSLHRLRKQLRDIMHLYWLAAATDAEPIAQSTYFFLFRINHALGNDHDRILAQTYRHKNPSSNSASLSKDKKQLIGEFLGSIKQSSI